MEDDFDMAGAVDSVASGLGIELSDPKDDTTDNPGAPAPAPAADPANAPSTAPAPAPASTPINAPVSQQPTAHPPPAPAPGPLQAPGTWKPEAKGEWDKIPASVQAEIHRRETDISRGISQYSQAAAVGHSYNQAIQPYAGLLQQNNLDPVKVTGDLFQIYRALATGTPEEKAQTLRTVAQQFGVNLGEATSSDDSPYVDPEVKALRDQLSTVQSQLRQINDQSSRQQQEQQQRIQASLTNELNVFASDPENAFFDEVAPDMALLIKNGRASDLKQAYKLAMSLNPQTQEKENLRLQAKAQAEKAAAGNSQKAAVDKTTAARNATGANVRASGASGKAKTAADASLRTMDVSMSDAYDAIVAASKD